MLFAVFAAVFAVTHLFTDYVLEEITRTQMEVDGKLSAAKEKGWLRSEGKEYVVKDGDVMHFLFNV